MNRDLCDECKRVGNAACLHSAKITMRAGYPSWGEIDELRDTLRVVLETRGATFAAIGQALRRIEERLLNVSTSHASWRGVNGARALVVDANEVLQLRAELVAVASAIAAVAALVELPLTTLDRIQ